ncbi:MAG: SagB/ThcOx family dehydrogenase, partial [Candidatus Bathyarchaeia archaeon]
MDFPQPTTDALQAVGTDPNLGDDQPLEVERLAELLFFTAGLTREVRTPIGPIYFRAAPATGALYPNELYVVCPKLPGLEAGVYHFSPGEFSMTQLRQGDFRSALAQLVADSRSVATAPVTLVFSSIAWRNSWKYEARSYRHWFWDSGVMVANLLATAASFGLSARVILGFHDNKVNKLMGLDGRHEAAVALVSLGKGNVESRVDLSIADIRMEVAPLSTLEVEYPEIQHIHEASSIATVEQLNEWVNAATETGPAEEDSKAQNKLHEMPEDYPISLNLDETILHRGSTRKFQQAEISFSQLSAILQQSTRGVSADFLRNRETLVDTYIIVNAVGGIPSGSYFFNRNQRSLQPLKSGQFRSISGHLCLDQALSAHASAVAFLMTDIHQVLRRFGNRGYRAAQFEAGVVAGKIYLCSYALRLGASGLTFFDDEVTQFFSPHAQDKSNMIVVAIGLPA